MGHHGNSVWLQRRSTSIEVQQHTDRFLQGLLARVVKGTHDMRVIAGDWHVERGNLPQADLWESKGWLETQQIAYVKW